MNASTGQRSRFCRRTGKVCCFCHFWFRPSRLLTHRPTDLTRARERGRERERATGTASTGQRSPARLRESEIGILLPVNQRQHRTLHIQKDVLPCALRSLPWSVSAARASLFWMDSMSTSYLRERYHGPMSSGLGVSKTVTAFFLSRSLPPSLGRRSRY